MSEQILTENLHRVHAPLKIRLGIYYLFGLALLAIAVFHVVTDHVTPIFPAIAVIVGLGIGTLSSRMYKISWSRGAKKAISEFDILGAVILLLYVFFELYHEEIVEHFVQGPVVVATGFALLAGIMAGKILGIRTKVVQVLNKHLK